MSISTAKKWRANCDTEGCTSFVEIDRGLAHERMDALNLLLTGNLPRQSDGRQWGWSMRDGKLYCQEHRPPDPDAMLSYMQCTECGAFAAYLTQDHVQRAKLACGACENPNAFFKPGTAPKQPRQ